MFGYACKQTKDLMPLPIMLAHGLARKLSEVRKKKVLPYLGPDGKTQVTVEYRDGKPVRVDYVVVAASHTAAAVTPDGKFTTEEAKQEIVDQVVQPVLGDLLDEKTTITVNGTGKFLVSGPQADTGLTGPQDHRGYLRWVGPARGRGVQRQGSHEGGPLGRVHGEVCREEHRRGRTGGGVPGPTRLLHRAGRSGVRDGEHATGPGRSRTRSLSKLVRKVFPLSPRGIIDHLKLRSPSTARQRRTDTSAARSSRGNAWTPRRSYWPKQKKI